MRGGGRGDRGRGGPRTGMARVGGILLVLAVIAVMAAVAVTRHGVGGAPRSTPTKRVTVVARTLVTLATVPRATDTVIGAAAGAGSPPRDRPPSTQEAGAMATMPAPSPSATPSPGGTPSPSATAVVTATHATHTPARTPTSLAMVTPRVPTGSAAATHAPISTTEPAPTRIATPHKAPRVRQCAGATPPCPPSARLPGTLLIADRGNSRLIMVNAAKRIVWTFPRPGDLGPSQAFVGPDDAFFTPDGRHIITNQEEAQTIGIIDYRTHRLVWQYGHLYYRGSAPGYLNEPDDAYQLPNGLVTVADIRNCRIIFLSRGGHVVRQYGETGVCIHDPPLTYASPNGDTPLPDGGMLITEIGGSNVVRLDRKGRAVFSIAVPWVAYASDAQLLKDGSVLLADYSSPGGIVRVSPRGQLLWRYTPARYPDVLNHPSLAIMLPNGLIAANDDWNHRVVLIDPHRQTIVWQYGVTGVPGSAPGYLDVPDGIDFRPRNAR